MASADPALITGVVNVLNLRHEPLEWATKRAVVRDNFLFLYAGPSAAAAAADDDDGKEPRLEGVLALSVLRVQQSTLQERAIELVNAEVRLIIHCPGAGGPDAPSVEDWFCALWAASRLTIDSKYKIGRTLGRGRFGKVKYATHRRTGRPFAIKIVPKSVLVADRVRLLNEIAVHKLLDHPRILRLYEVFETADSVFLIMELLRGGELFDRIVAQTDFSEYEAAGVVADCCDGLAYLHAKSVAHRDIKPENLVFDEIGPMGRVKITDFGLAKLCGEQQLMSSTVGTPSYVAPEVVSGRGYGFSADMWSLGVVLYVLLSGVPPFSGPSAAAVLEKVRKAEYSFPPEAFAHVSPLAMDVVRGLMEPDPARRLRPEDVKNSAWMQSASRTRSNAVSVNMRKHAASLRFKRAGLAVIAARRFAQLGLERGRRAADMSSSDFAGSVDNSPVVALSAYGDNGSPRSAPSPTMPAGRPHSKSAPEITLKASLTATRTVGGAAERARLVAGPAGLEAPSFPTSPVSGGNISPSVSLFTARARQFTFGARDGSGDGDVDDETKGETLQVWGMQRPLSMPVPDQEGAEVEEEEVDEDAEARASAVGDADEMEVEEAHFMVVHSTRYRAVSTLRERVPPDRRQDSGGGDDMEQEEEEEEQGM